MANWLDDVEDPDEQEAEEAEEENEETEEGVEQEETETEMEEEEEAQEETEVETDETDDEPAQTPSTSSGGVDVSSLAPDAVTGSQAAQNEYTWRTYFWGGPGVGKTHAALTSPSPVCVIDTEGKSDALAHKFTKRGEYDDPFIWQPSNYDEVQEALDQVISLLEEFEEKEGVKGTIVVDSMSDMWRWSKEKYIDIRYGGKDLADVSFQSEIGEGSGDWKHIKKWHNTKFRQRLTETDFHTSLTDTEKDDIRRTMEGAEGKPIKPGGEKDNDYKAANHVVHIVDGPNGVPIGVIEKSDIVKWKVIGIERPTFPKVKEIIETIRDVGEDKSRDYLERQIDYNVVLQESKPKRIPGYYAERENW